MGNIFPKLKIYQKKSSKNRSFIHIFFFCNFSKSPWNYFKISSQSFCIVFNSSIVPLRDSRIRLKIPLSSKVFYNYGILSPFSEVTRNFDRIFSKSVSNFLKSFLKNFQSFPNFSTCFLSFSYIYNSLKYLLALLKIFPFSKFFFSIFPEFQNTSLLLVQSYFTNF